MRTSIWIAIGLLAAVAAWLASGILMDGEEEQQAEAEPSRPTLVEVRNSTAQEVPQYLYAQGVAQPYRTADVTASVGGTLSEVQAKQGDVVEAGTVLAQVSLAARESELQSAQSRVDRLEADLAAVRELESEGFATESRVRELQSQLEEARAALESIREDISNTSIEAPIPGIVSDVFVNSSERVAAGTTIARIVDNAPLRVTLNISQRDVGRVDVGREAAVSFATGTLARGRLCFVAPAADPQTRTFRVEIRVPNEERTIPSVVSTEVRLQTGAARAHLISPAILSLSEAGALGVKSVNDENLVQFHPVEIVRTEGDGVWVDGLPSEVRLITVGQGFVREGERVRTKAASEEDGEGALVEAAVGGAPLPTATVETEAFEGAGTLPDPPPAEDLCAGAAANSVLTSSVPSAPSGASAAGSGQGATQPGGGAGSIPGGGMAEPGTPASEGAANPSTTPPSSIGPISPSIPSPPVGGGSQQQGGAPQQQQGTGGGGASAPATGAQDSGAGGSGAEGGGP